MRNRIHVNQLDIGWMNSDHERKIQAGGIRRPGLYRQAGGLVAVWTIARPRRGGEGRVVDGV